MAAACSLFNHMAAIGLVVAVAAEAAASPAVVSPPSFPAVETAGAATAGPDASAPKDGGGVVETGPPSLFPAGRPAGMKAEEPAAAPEEETPNRDATPASRLIRMLRDGPAPGAEAGPPSRLPEAAAPAAGPVVFGCPRGALTALLAGATERSDAASALAIERETLTLCRERQEVVTRIFRLEEELTALLGKTGDSPATAAPVPAGETGATPRVISQLDSPGGTDRSPPSREAAEPVPSYAWFSIIGTPGRLRAGVSNGRRAWFVREGDRLPGAGVVERIAARPPGVHAGGIALPYGPRPSGDGQ